MPALGALTFAVSRGRLADRPRVAKRRGWLLGRALALETHGSWLEATRYLNREHLHQHKKEVLRQAA
jgi:hypothetical protein